MIAICACGALLSYYNNSPLFFIILAVAPVILPIEYVKLWHVPKIEAVKTLCIILIVEGIPLLCYTGYAVVPLALLYLIARKKRERQNILLLFVFCSWRQGFWLF
jgi:energy-converting hydrogenase Eha subunit G